MVNTHWPITVFEHMVKILNPLYRKTLNIRSSELDTVISNNSNSQDIMPVLVICKYQKDLKETAHDETIISDNQRQLTPSH